MWPTLCALAVLAAALFAYLWLAALKKNARRRGDAASTHRDELQRLQRKARESDENFRSILASMAEGVVAVDRRRVIQLANPSVLRLFALKQEPAGQSVLSALRLPLLETMMRAAIEEGAPQQEETTVQVVPGQNPVHLIISTLPMGEAANPYGAVTVIRDISRLRELEEMRREFVANVSHELRTPLAIFHGYLENLLDRPDMPQDEMLPVLKVMQKHSGRLNALVEDLLTLTRLESRRDPLSREPADLRDFFATIAGEWAARAAQTKVAIRVEVDPALPAVALDPHRFRQVLDNLLENAVKYSPADGVVTLRATRHDASVQVQVEDHGAGIPPADLPHIFERFYRADKARSRELGGTGLGLSIVKHIVQAHGGTVAAASVYGKGTTITLTIPLQPPPTIAVA
jgi:two-component system phosphate regulon sensor histidine kinase PhoR